MRHRFLIALAAVAALNVMPAAGQQPAQPAGAAVHSFYDLQTKTLKGEPGNLAGYRGKVSLVVNVASKCGYTPQYEGLEKLQKEGEVIHVITEICYDFSKLLRRLVVKDKNGSQAKEVKQEKLFPEGRSFQ